MVLRRFISIAVRVCRSSLIPSKVFQNRLFSTSPKMSTPTTSDYGSWKSPITSAIATESAIAFMGLEVDPKNSDVVYWVELRYSEKGRYVICSYDHSTGKTSEWTPAGFSARTVVHEYGGGNFFPFNGKVYFSNYEDQRIYSQSSPDADPVAITPSGTKYKFADGMLYEKTGLIYLVREDHSGIDTKDRSEPENCIVVLNPANGEIKVLASGTDFYASPKVSPDGRKLTWMQWAHPNMPWDSSSIHVANLSDCGMTCSNTKQVAGCEGVSVLHPRFDSDNRLLYISDESEWWNLYRMDLSAGTDSSPTCVVPESKEMGGPHWQFAYHAFDSRFGSDIPFVTGSLRQLSADGSTTEISTGFKNHSFVNGTNSGDVYCVAASPTQFSSVIRVSKDGQVKVIKESKKNTFDLGYLSVPVEKKFPTTEGEFAYGYYYPPQNKDYVAAKECLPPLLVKIHGGPTSCSVSSLNLKIQYFTSRGFAVMDVNHRGSTGYGRTFRHRLRKSWGVIDVEDSCQAAEYLAGQGLADSERLCIDGGSAGGYTTLAALAFKDTFKAGCSLYGISDVELLASDTHKFEARYMDTMIGAYPEEKKVYIDRSPINHIEGFNQPLCLFQGTEDKVVPPSQAQMIFDAVLKKGIPCSLTMFEGEQHGFRQAPNIQKALDGEYYFYSKIFGFESHFDKPVVSISNAENIGSKKP